VGVDAVDGVREGTVSVLPERRVRDADRGWISAWLSVACAHRGQRRLSYPPLSTGYPPLIPEASVI